MNRGFYPRLAWTGMKQNRRLYLPYLLSCAGMVLMFYILMGLSVLVVFKQLFALSPTACYWIIAEGVCYITGAAFYSLRKARYMHSDFHFFVLGGSACHMGAVWDILVKML